jgi:hypothetical protein
MNSDSQVFNSTQATPPQLELVKASPWRLAFCKPYPRVLLGAAVLVLAVTVGLIGIRRDLTSRHLSGASGVASVEDRAQVMQQFAQSNNLQADMAVSPSPNPPQENTVEKESQTEAPQPPGPMIAQTAALSILANNYDQAIASIQPLVKSQSGYVQKLDAQAETGSSRQFSATLRVPAQQLGSLLSELRKLGHVEQESQGNEEVTDQYVDLQARLKSARASEQRLLQLLATRTGKLEDVLDAERELARVRGEIESMEGQRILLAHRVDYATVDVQIREEYRKELGAEAPSTKTQLHNAAIEGFENLEEGVIDILLFLLNYGLSIIFWTALIGVPAVLIVRAIRAHSAKRST